MNDNSPSLSSFTEEEEEEEVSNNDNEIKTDHHHSIFADNDDDSAQGGGWIPMWLYVKTIGITGAKSITNMRDVLIQQHQLNHDREKESDGSSTKETNVGIHEEDDDEDRTQESNQQLLEGEETSSSQIKNQNNLYKVNSSKTSD